MARRQAPSTRQVDEVLRESLRRAHRLLDQATAPELLRFLGDADRRLRARLQRVTGTGGRMRFTEAQARAYQAQIAIVTKYAQQRLLGVTHQQAVRAVSSGVRETARDLTKLNSRFTGVVVPLRIHQAGVLGGIDRRVKATLLQQHRSSVQRYGRQMIGTFATVMRRGMLAGASADDIVDQLVKKSGGMFTTERWRAERIVRTEVAHADNAARFLTMQESRARDFPDLKKKILAVFDNRTAFDSIAVHGQVRPLEGLFIDGAGRQYLYPPARPNDRETVTPWRDAWPETPYSAPVPQEEIDKIKTDRARLAAARIVALDRESRADESTLERQSAAAMKRVHELIATKTVEIAQRNRARQVAVERHTLTERARADRAETIKKAREALAAAGREVIERQQRIVTAEGRKRFAQKQTELRTRARAKSYKKNAEGLTPAMQQALDHLRANNKPFYSEVDHTFVALQRRGLIRVIERLGKMVRYEVVPK